MLVPPKSHRSIKPTQRPGGAFRDRSWDRLWLTHHLVPLARALPGIHILEIKGTSAGGAALTLRQS